MNKDYRNTIIRTSCLALALVNQILSAFDVNVIPIEDETVSQLVTAGATIVTSVIAWWKNNSITKEAQMADEYMHSLKNGDDIE